MVLFCISLMASDVKHLFIYLVTIHRWSWVKSLYRSFVHLKNWFVFLLLSFTSHLFILNLDHLLDKWFTNIFSQSRTGFYISLTLFFSKVLNFDLVYFLLWFMFLVSYLRTLHLTQDHDNFPSFESFI